MTSSMPATRTRVRTTLAAVMLAVAVGTSLAACSGTPLDNLVGGAVDRAIDETIGENIDLTTDGQLPAGFPVDAVPLVDGTVIGGAAGGDAGWTVVLQPDSVERYAEAQAALEGAGFTATLSNADADSALGSFAGSAYNVQLTFSTGSDGVVTAIYVVTPV